MEKHMRDVCGSDLWVDKAKKTQKLDKNLIK